MGIGDLRDALGFEYGAVRPITFFEKDGNITCILSDRDGQDTFISSSAGELVTDYANLILDKKNKNPCIKALCDELDSIVIAGEDVLYKSYVAARQYGAHTFAWSIAREVYYDLHIKGAGDSLTYSWRINFNALMCRDFISGKKITDDPQILFNAVVSIDRTGKLCIDYSSDNPLCVLQFHMVKMQELNLKPNICQVCGRAFMPVSKSNEKYCRKKRQDGRTCYDIAMIAKEKEDPFQCVFRKAYKTMAQRASRAKGCGYNKIQEKNEQWRKEAKAKQQECRASNDLAGFTKWIEDSLKQ